MSSSALTPFKINIAALKQTAKRARPDEVLVDPGVNAHKKSKKGMVGVEALIYIHSSSSRPDNFNSATLNPVVTFTLLKFTGNIGDDDKFIRVPKPNTDDPTAPEAFTFIPRFTASLNEAKTIASIKAKYHTIKRYEKLPGEQTKKPNELYTTTYKDEEEVEVTLAAGDTFHEVVCQKNGTVKKDNIGLYKCCFYYTCSINPPTVDEKLPGVYINLSSIQEIAPGIPSNMIRMRSPLIRDALINRSLGGFQETFTYDRLSRIYGKHCFMLGPSKQTDILEFDMILTTAHELYTSPHGNADVTSSLLTKRFGLNHESIEILRAMIEACGSLEDLKDAFNGIPIGQNISAIFPRPPKYITPLGGEPFYAPNFAIMGTMSCYSDGKLVETKYTLTPKEPFQKQADLWQEKTGCLNTGPMTSSITKLLPYLDGIAQASFDWQVAASEDEGDILGIYITDLRLDLCKASDKWLKPLDYSFLHMKEEDWIDLSADLMTSKVVAADKAMTEDTIRQDWRTKHKGNYNFYAVNSLSRESILDLFPNEEGWRISLLVPPPTGYENRSLDDFIAERCKKAEDTSSLIQAMCKVLKTNRMGDAKSGYISMPMIPLLIVHKEFKTPKLTEENKGGKFEIYNSFFKAAKANFDALAGVQPEEGRKLSISDSEFAENDDSDGGETE